MERVGRATCTGPSRTGLAARVAESEAGAERMKLLGTGGGRASVEPYGTQPR